jgi:hypothetical protein
MYKGMRTYKQTYVCQVSSCCCCCCLFVLAKCCWSDCGAGAHRTHTHESERARVRHSVYATECTQSSGNWRSTAHTYTSTLPPLHYHYCYILLLWYTQINQVSAYSLLLLLFDCCLVLCVSCIAAALPPVNRSDDRMVAHKDSVLCSAGSLQARHCYKICFFFPVSLSVPLVKTHTLTSWSNSLTHLSLPCRGDVNCGLSKVSLSPLHSLTVVLFVNTQPAAVQCERSLAACVQVYCIARTQRCCAATGASSACSPAAAAAATSLKGCSL